MKIKFIFIQKNLSGKSRKKIFKYKKNSWETQNFMKFFIGAPNRTSDNFHMKIFPQVPKHKIGRCPTSEDKIFNLS